MRTLTRYLGREVLAGTLLVLMALLILFAFFDLVHEMRDLGRGNYRLVTIFLYVLLTAPSHIYELFPIAALIGTLYALTTLSANSELTVMRVSGLSVPRIGMALMRVGLALVVANFVIGELVAPYAERFAQQRQLEALNSVVAQQFRSGLWVKDDRSFINVQEMMPDTTLHDLKIYQFDSGHRLASISFAKRGEYRGNNIWRISDVEQTLFQGDAVTVTRTAQSDWKSVLTPDILGVLLVTPEQMSIWSLVTYIEHLRENNQKTVRYEIAAYSKIIYPCAILVMMLLAVPFSVVQRRSGGVGARVFLGIMLGLTFHLLNRLCADLGVLYNQNALVSTAIPSLVFLALALAAMYRVQRT